MATNACGAESTAGMMLFRLEDDGITYTAIDYVDQMTDFDFKAGIGDCTDPYQATGGWKERFKDGSFDAGETTFEVRWKPGSPSHTALWLDFLSPDARGYRLQFSDADASQIDFNALVSSWGSAHPGGEGGKVTRPVGLAITGAPGGTALPAAA